MSNLVRVLIVDENPYFRTAVAEFLQLYSALQVVGTAGDSQSAVTQAEQSRPDVILLDLNVGDPPGLERISALRERLSDVKIIVLSMMHQKCGRSTIQACGADAFVPRADLRQSLFSVIMNLVFAYP